jgi:hypothetical protein
MGESRDKAPGAVRRIIAKVEGLGGLAAARELEFRSGTTNRVGGVNAVGKSTAAQAVAWALGDESAVPEINDGADIGVVEVAEIGPEGEPVGKVSGVVPSRGRARRKGEPSVETSEKAVRALDILLTGDHAKTAETRNKERIKAFLAIVKPEVDAAAAKILCEGDTEYAAWLLDLAQSGRVGDLLAGAKALQERLQREAREQEAAADGWNGKASGAAEQVATLTAALAGAAVPPNPNPAAAEEEAARARLALAEVKRDATARTEKEEMQARIRASSTIRPNTDGAEAEARGYLAARDAARKEAAEIEVQLAQLQERLAAARQREAYATEQGKEAEARWRVAVSAAEAWDSQQALLAEVVTGPGMAEINAADDRVATANGMVRVHRAAVDLQRFEALAEDATLQATRSAARAKELRAWNAAVPARVADVLAKSGGSGFTISEGFLAFRVNGGEPQDFDGRLSPGQKVKAVFPLVAQHLRGWVMLSGEVYRAWLDDAGRLAVEEWAAQHPECFVVTEEPTSGDLHVGYGPFVQGGA